MVNCVVTRMPLNRRVLGTGEAEGDKARSVARLGSECPLEAGRMEWQSSSSKLVVARQEDVPNVVHDDSWDAGLSMPGSR